MNCFSSIHHLLIMSHLDYKRLYQNERRETAQSLPRRGRRRQSRRSTRYWQRRQRHREIGYKIESSIDPLMITA